MNFEVIHPETAKFFQNTKTQLEVVALAVSGRHPERKQCFAYIDCVFSYKRTMNNPIVLALLKEFEFTAEYGVGKVMEYPLWSMAETYDLHNLPHTAFLKKYPYRTDPAARSRRKNHVLPAWIEKHGTGADSELNESIPHFYPPRIRTTGSSREVIAYLEKTLIPSTKVSGFLLNIEAKVYESQKTSDKHRLRVEELCRRADLGFNYKSRTVY